MKILVVIAALLVASLHAFSVQTGSKAKITPRTNSELRATDSTKKYRFPSDQDQVDINRADIYDTWTPAAIQQYKPPGRLLKNNREVKQFIPSPAQKYGNPTMAQTKEEVMDQIGALATKAPTFLPGESRDKEYRLLKDPRFGAKYPPWIQSC
jgi:hypothetical protein